MGAFKQGGGNQGACGFGGVAPGFQRKDEGPRNALEDSLVPSMDVSDRTSLLVEVVVRNRSVVGSKSIPTA